MNLENLTIKEARRLLDSKELSVKELVEYYLKNIEEKNKELNIYLEVYEDVLEQADRAQEIIDKGEAKDLTGIPLSIKDNTNVLLPACRIPFKYTIGLTSKDCFSFFTN